MEVAAACNKCGLLIMGKGSQVAMQGGRIVGCQVDHGVDCQGGGMWR